VRDVWPIGQTPQSPVSSRPLGRTVWRDQSRLSQLVQQDFDVLQFAENAKKPFIEGGYAPLAVLQKQGCGVPFFQ
jgi:hypothetical protein